MPMPRKLREKCLNCGKENPRVGYKYCSNSCQQEYQYRSYIKKWKNGEVSGIKTLGIVSRYIKRYLREKFANKCCLCGWAKVNSRTGGIPLVADHIDGNWHNNTESNLRLICPNCDSLLPTYAGLNRGNGRINRVVSKRAKDSRSLTNKVP
jgi:hypothetical protein